MDILAPTLNATTLDEGEAVEITAEGLGSLLITRTRDEATGQWIFLVITSDATNPVQVEI